MKKSLDLVKRLSRMIMNEYDLVIGQETYDLVSLGIHVRSFEDDAGKNSEDYNNEFFDPHVSKRDMNMDKPLHWFVGKTHAQFLDLNIGNNVFYGGLRINQISNDQEYGSGKVVSYIERKISKDISFLDRKRVRDTKNSIFLRKKLIKRHKDIIERPRHLGFYSQNSAFEDLFYFRCLELTSDFDSVPVTSKDSFYPLSVLPYVLNGKHGRIMKESIERDKIYIEYFNIGFNSKDEFDLIKRLGNSVNEAQLVNCAKFGFYTKESKI